MFLKTFYSLWRRIVMGDKRIVHLFLDDNFNVPRSVEHWASDLTSHSESLVHERCYITSIAFYKARNGVEHEYLQFTVTMKKDRGGSQEATFETHRTVCTDEQAKVNGSHSFGTSSSSASRGSMNIIESAPPVVQGIVRESVTSSALVLGTPAYDYVLPRTPMSGQAECDNGNCPMKRSGQNKCEHDRRLIVETFEFGKLPLVRFALLLKSVGSYSGYRLLKTQCYWYAYTVYVLAIIYAARTKDFDWTANGTTPTQRFAAIYEEAKNLAPGAGLVFPKDAGKCRVIPIPRDDNGAKVWNIFDMALKDYMTSSLYAANIQLIARAEEADAANIQLIARAQEAEARIQTMQSEIEALKSQLQIYKPDI